MHTSVALIASEIKVLLLVLLSNRRPDECERSDPASMVHPSKRKRAFDGLLGVPCAAPSVRRLPGKYLAPAHITKPDAESCSEEGWVLSGARAGSHRVGESRGR
jgi:hypothetical protein